MKKTTILISALLLSLFSIAQTPFEVKIEPITVPGLAGLQGYAFAQDSGKWLIIGGRIDGLHKRQPSAAFDAAGLNNNLTVIDPVSKQKWTASISSLPTAIKEQISSTNMGFHQEGKYLYFIGGYGYSATESDHITYNKMTAIDVPATINAVVNATSFTSYFRQITDNKFAVTGGHLEKIYNTYYLIGGNKFTGRYNPMGNSSYVQVYTDAAHKFTITDNGTSINITHLGSLVDTDELHRRDYNVTAQIMPNGQEGLTAFSGVFQKTVNLPFLNCVNLDSSGYVVNNAFSQHYNHYHCANIPMYSTSNSEMHTVFFGGIAQYYDSSGTMVQDDNVPFVKTIARVTRNSAGVMTEYKLPVEMPAFLGAGSEFIPVDNNIKKFHNGVVKLDLLPQDTTLVGYIYGGINSSAKNIFFAPGSSGTLSTASSKIFEVYIINTNRTGLDEMNVHSNGKLRMRMYPNPNRGILKIDLDIAYRSNLKVTITDISGKIIKKEEYRKSNFTIGKNHLEIELDNLSKTVLFVTLETKNDKITQKLILR